MEMGNDPSAAKDFSGQKEVIMTNDSTLAVVQGTRYKLGEWPFGSILEVE
jgi:hypothetical protein